MLSILMATNVGILGTSLETQTARRIAELDTLLVAALAVPLVARDQGALQDILDAVRQREGVEFLVLVNARGLVMARSGWPLGVPPPLASTGPPSVEAQRWDAIVPVTLGGQIYGRLHYGLSTAFFGKARSSMMGLNFAIAVTEVVLSALILSFIGFMLTRRLRILARASRAIAAGDLGARAEIRGNGDEIDRLGTSFNHMAEALDSRVRELSKLWRAIEQGPMAVVITDRHGTIEYVNPQFHAISGYAPEEAIGGNPRLLKSGLTPPEVYRELWSTILSGGVWRGNFLNRRKDGGLFWEDAAIAPVSDQTGAISHFVAVKIDITAKRAKEEELAKVVERLTQTNTELERFAYVASHDLKEPLRTVISFAQLLDKRFAGTLGDEGAEYLRFVVGASTRMNDLISDLLVFSRIGASGRQFAVVSTDYACRAALENLHERIIEEKAEITVPALPEIEADGVQLVQLFQNLLGNAIKFRRPGVAPEVSVTVRREGEFWEFAVADNGIGFNPGEQDVFEIFRRLHSAVDYPGTGVGLAICKRIVLRHGGRIWAESELGHGSVFHFTLPAVPDRPSS